MGSILQTLVSGVCVDSGHQTLFNAKGIVENLCQRSQAVGGAGCVGDNVMVLRIVLLVVHAHHEGTVNILTGCRNNNLLSAGINVRLCF